VKKGHTTLCEAAGGTAGTRDGGASGNGNAGGASSNESGGGGDDTSCGGGAGGSGIIFLEFDVALPCIDAGDGYNFDFKSGGSVACIVPDGVTTVDILVVGGGGGGGYANLETDDVGGGGGGGAVVVCTDVSVTAGDTLSLEIGAPGNGGQTDFFSLDSYYSATDGGTTSVGDLCTASGGKAGGDATGTGGESGSGKVGGSAYVPEPVAAGGGGGGAAAAGSSGVAADPDPCAQSGAGGPGLQVSALATPGLFDDVDDFFGGGGGGGNIDVSCFGGLGGIGGGGDGSRSVAWGNQLGDDGIDFDSGDRLRSSTGGGGGGGSAAFCAPGDGPCGGGGGGAPGYIELRFTSGTTDVPVVVTPPAAQTITYGQDPNLTPTDDLPGGVDWDEAPTCAVYAFDETEFIEANVIGDRPLPPGDYLVACSGGSEDGYTVDHSAAPTELKVNKATATLTYTGASGVASGPSITLSGTVSPDVCPASSIVYTVNGTEASSPFEVDEGTVYEIEMSYDDPSCDAPPVYAIVLAGTAGASNGGGQYKVSDAGKINFGYTVQLNKSKNGSTQVSGQIVWNSQNGKFRYKGVITGFVKTTTVCASEAVCGQIIGSGTLRTSDGSGDWDVVGSSLGFRASVVDAGSATTCKSGKKSTCTTVAKPDFFGLDITGATVTGEQLLDNGWPSPVQLSSGNLVIK
jgi:hypothetical protein